MVEWESEFRERHLLFRNYLRVNIEARENYCRLKKGLAKLEWKNGDDFSDAKVSFIRAVEKKAKEYFSYKSCRTSLKIK